MNDQNTMDHVSTVMIAGPAPNVPKTGAKFASVAFRVTMFVLTTAFLTLNGISFPLALSGNTDMTSFTIYTQALYALIFTLMEAIMEVMAGFFFAANPQMRRLTTSHAKALSPAAIERALSRHHRNRWLVRGAAEWWDQRHMISLGLLTALNALMSAYGGSADRTPLTVQAAMNMLTNILGVRMKIAAFGLSEEIPWFSLSKFNRYYYGSGLCFTVACALVIIDRLFIAKVADGQFGPLAILYALGNLALVAYIVELDRMLADAEADKAAVKKLSADVIPLTGRRSVAAAPTASSPLLLAEVKKATPYDDLGPEETEVIVDDAALHEQHFDASDAPRSSFFKIFAHVHRTLALLRRVSLAGLVFVLLLSLFALIPGLDQAGTFTLERFQNSVCPMIGMENLYINLQNIAIVFGFITQTILNEIDGSLVMTAANASQILQLAVGWVPSIGPLAVGYFPNIPLTLLAMVLSVIGVWCAQKYSVELAEISAAKSKRDTRV